MAVAALGIALAAMIGVGIMVESFRESLHAWLERSLRADFYVSAPGAGFARPERRIDPAILETLLAVRGVAAHSESRRVTLESSRGPVAVDALKLIPESYAGIELIAGQPSTVAWPAFAAGAIVISEPLAWRLHLATGDTPSLSRRPPARADFALRGSIATTAMIGAMC